MLSPLDDYPVHQTSQPVMVVATSDRNFYDRYYFNLFAKDQDLFVTAGLGQYPNLGVVDGFVAATRGSVQHVVRASRELGGDRMDTSVGPISVNVIEGLKRLRLRLEPNEGPIELDVEWTPSIPAFLEARHVNRRGVRITTETSRFAQTGFWSGTMSIDGTTFEVEPTRWWGGRDRSWGIRPVGEPEPVVRRAGEETGGFLWLYCTMQFESSTVICILQEDRHGARSLEQAVRVWTDPAREPEAYSHIEHDIEFVSGTRRVEVLRLHMRDGNDRSITIEGRPFGASYLSLGTGYGAEREWRHGMYQGPETVQHRAYDLSDADVMRASYGLIDNVATFEVDGAQGYGLLENAVLGPNDRYRFSGR
ncbi:MAG: hypothetical protein JWM12_4107 [Ilumatobacteraceae bacterium]|nr:hypothetical protein [Ilumatobacteraceae bacterium]